MCQNVFSIEYLAFVSCQVPGSHPYVACYNFLVNSKLKLFMNPVVHFEMPYEDKDRMAKFYQEAFGWKPQFLGSEMGNYVVEHTCETDENGMPLKAGMINGGFYKKPKDPMGQHPSIVVSTDDLRATMEKVRASGGTMMGEPMMIPGIGEYASFIDTEGNRNSIIQPIMPS